MGKRDVRVIRVPKRVTVILLIALTLGMTGVIYALAGHAYESRTTGDVLRAAVGQRYDQGFSGSRMLALLMPVVANAIVFVPWGFLAFLAIDRKDRSRARSHVLTVLAGAAFAAAVAAWQTFLPTRVTAPSDVLASAAGTFAGAILGQLRKDVRIRFDY